MANDTRSSRKIKDDEGNNSKRISGKGSTALGSATTDTSGLRRSARETSSKKPMFSSPASTRKSERLEKRTPPTPPVKRKSERVEKQRMPSPSRRSERGKKNHPLSSSGSKKSENGLGSSDMKRKKEKREKSVKQLTLEAREVIKSGKQDLKPGHMKNKNLHAHTYRALFKVQAKKDKSSDLGEKVEKPDKLSRGDSNNNEDGDTMQSKDGDNEHSERRGEELREEYLGRACERAPEESNSPLRKFAKETSGNHGEVELSHSSPKHSCTEEADKSQDGDGLKVSKSGDSPLLSSHGVIAKETPDDAEKMQVDCSATEKMQTRELVDSTFKGRSLDGYSGLERSHKVTPFKRKRETLDMDSDASATVASKDICTSIDDAVSSSPSGCKRNNFVETCVACFKRQRVDYDSPKQELCSCNAKLNQNLCDTSIPKDRGELEASVTTGLTEKCNNNAKRRESPLNIQTDGDQNTCVVCKLGGKLLCCDGKGCKRSYHLSCLDPPLEDVPLGVWHCLWCVKKRIESGVHSVSGVDSIWDAREVEVSDVEGLRRQKQYFVKYKGLAHVHNHWVSETQLLLEAPLLVAKFNRKSQFTRWKLEWTMPHRLVQKRLLMSPKQRDEYNSGHAADNSDCHYEWLVKWRGLDYDHATWELENASFLNSPEARSLIREYENRREKAKEASFLSTVDKRGKGPLIKLLELPASLSGIDNSHLYFVNKLREYWHKGQNAVVIDDQERVAKVILFILSLQSDVCRPFLIISASNALSLWEAEFLRLAPSVNVVIYNGNRDIRRSIRTLEFYEEGGCVMFQVLLSPPEAIVEDLEVLECLGWEAIIVDECHRSRILTHSEQIKMLATDFKLLLVSGQMKDSTAEYVNMLSLLDSDGDLNSSDVMKTESNDNIGKLKERLSRFIAYECKSDSSRFVEYWVPVQISNVQLEQYCSTLLSNSISLRSCSKNDPVGAVRDILISTRKCCDHPYIVDQSLQVLLTKGLPEVEYLDVGIKASGKLQLLDTMLSVIRNRGLRVLILFQSIGGSGRDSIGDILDDFLRQRFGPDSYERVDGGGQKSKKQAALNKFNNKESGRFVFLLETRACLASIKLSLVDTIIIFDSDWNAVNDLRALQRITIDSQLEQIKVFRLYSSCTVEEKVLILAKQDMTLDSNVQNISRSTSHMLLMWGASYLFNNLDEFHGCNTPSSANISSEQSLLNDVVQEFSALLSQNGENNDTSNSSVILKVQQHGGAYSRNISLLGELKSQLTDEKQPHVFWTKLLEGRHPRWKYSSGPPQRNRKRVQYFDELQKKTEFESDEVAKKRNRVANNSVDPASLKPGLDEGKLVAGDKEGASGTPSNNGSQSLPGLTACMIDIVHANHASTSPLLANDISEVPEVHMVESEERRKLRDAQKSLHLILKPEISKLCEILHLSEDVKGMVGRFLEYVINNHHVNREPMTILQAFQISLCWTAASLLKHKIDRKESLTLAKQHLNFSCKEEEADYIYSKLRLLKKVFLNRSENLKESDSPKGAISAAKDKDDTKELLCARASQSTASNQQKVKIEIGESSSSQECSNEKDLSQQGQAPEFKMAEKEISEVTKRIQKKYQNLMKKLVEKQQEEVQEFYKVCEEEKNKLEKDHQVESALIRSIHSHIPVRIDRLKVVDDNFAKNMEDHKHQMHIRLKNLEAIQTAARNEVTKQKARTLDELKSRAQEELLGKLPLRGSGHRVECLQTSERVRADDPENVVPVSGLLSEDQSPDEVVHSVPGSGVVPSEIPESVPTEAVACSIPIETGKLPMKPISKNDELDTMASERASGFKQCHQVGSSSDGPENVVSVSLPSSEEQIPDGALSSVPVREVPLEVPETASNKALEGDDFIEMATPVMESNRENEEMDATDSDRPNAAEINQHNEACSSMNGCSLSPELSLVNSPLMQPVTTPHQGGPFPLDQALQDECYQPSASTGMQDGDAPARGKQNISQPVEVSPLHPVDVGPSDQSNQEALVIEPVVQLPLSPSTDFPPGHSQPNLPSASGVGHLPSSEGHTSFQNAQAPAQLVEHPVELSNQAASQPVTHLALHPRMDTPGAFEAHLSDTRTAHAPAQLVGNPVELSNEPVTHLALHPPIDTLAGAFEMHLLDSRTMPIIPESSNRPVQTAPPAASRMPLPLYLDPLQNELERIHKETDQTIRIHDDTKLRLKSDCEKEIEENIAQIRRKYEAKLHDVEAAFLLKKKELETNQNKVLMNKILAEAFRTKCMDLRAPGTPGKQQAVPRSLMQQLLQLSSQQPPPRPSPVGGSPLVGPPVSSPQSTVPSVQVVHHSSALFSSISGRPPHISPITPPTGNLQIGSEIRAPAPHLQPFRPSTSMSSASLPSLQRVMPSQQAPSNPHASALSLPQLPSRLPPPTYQSGPYNRAPRPESAGGLPALHNSSLSALELLTDIDNQPGANPPGILPYLPDLSPNFDSWDPSEFGTPGSIRISAAHAGAGADVVCLSDDD